MNRWLRSERPAPDDYDRRFEEAARAGQDMHGEASLVASLGVRSVLDAGCGTGRVAIELACRGIDVVGVDVDEAMLAQAKAKAPHLDWRLSDLAEPDLTIAERDGSLPRRFDAVVAAGNVMIFLEPGTEGAVVANLARHLTAGGALVAGFQLDGRLDLAVFDEHCRRAGLQLAHRWATWERGAWREGGDYAVSVHRLGANGGASGPATGT